MGVEAGQSQMRQNCRDLGSRLSRDGTCPSNKICPDNLPAGTDLVGCLPRIFFLSGSGSSNVSSTSTYQQPLGSYIATCTIHCVMRGQTQQKQRRNLRPTDLSNKHTQSGGGEPPLPYPRASIHSVGEETPLPP